MCAMSFCTETAHLDIKDICILVAQVKINHGTKGKGET